MYKFHYGERPKHERVEITLETEVPAIIPKEERKRNPDRIEFDNKMKAYDLQIESYRNKIANIITKKKETFEGGKVQGSSLSYKEFF